MSTTASIIEPRIAYYLWQFPLTSETFVQREIQALYAAGRAPLLIADAPGKDELLTPSAQNLANDTRYLLPIKPVGAAFAFLVHLWRRPRRALAALRLAMAATLPADVRLLDRVRILAKAAVLARMLETASIQHAHCPWSDVNAFVLRLATRLLSIPYSVQARAHDIHRSDRVRGLSERIADASPVITNCEFNRRYLVKRCGKEIGARIQVHRNGVAPEQFPAVALRPKPSPLRLLCVARLIEQKGLVDLLLACARLRGAGLAVECDIIGAPELPRYAAYHAGLLRLHGRLGLSACVRFLGPLPFDAVRAAHASTDVFVLPCVVARDGSRDISPNALIEAMASGLPVISTAIAPITEIVSDGLDGVLVAPGDSRALAKAIADLAEDHLRRLRLAAAARGSVARRFDIQVNARWLPPTGATVVHQGSR